MEARTAQVFVDNKQVPVNGYVERVVIAVVSSLIGTLHGCRGDEDITVQVSKEKT